MYKFEIVYGKGIAGQTMTEEVQCSDVYGAYQHVVEMLVERDLLDQVRSITRVDEGYNS